MAAPSCGDIGRFSCKLNEPLLVKVHNVSPTVSRNIVQILRTLVTRLVDVLENHNEGVRPLKDLRARITQRRSEQEISIHAIALNGSFMALANRCR